MQKIILSICVLCFFIHVHGQGDIQDDVRVFYGDEISFSCGVHTNGFGIGARLAHRKNALEKRFLEFQITSIIHPKEIKIPSDFGGKYVYGKNNNILSLMFSVGNQNEQFSKLDRGSVAVRYLSYAGVCLALEKPYYYSNPQKQRDYFLFNDSTSAARVKKAPYYIGFSEISLVPGIFAGIGVNFEFSNQPNRIQILEFGCNVQVYMRKLEILHTNSNSFIYPTIYMIYRFGKVLSTM